MANCCEEEDEHSGCVKHDEFPVQLSIDYICKEELAWLK